MIIKGIIKKVELSKKGTPFARVLVRFDEYPNVWISGFGNKRTWVWKVGDDVSPEIKQEGKYYNFSFDETEQNRLDVYSLPATVGFVMDLLKIKGSSQPNKTGEVTPLG